MSSEKKCAWIMLGVTVVAYATYLALILGRADGTGQSSVVVGGVAVLIMAMAEVDYFWIADAIYLAFVLSGILGSAAKLVAYRRGFQPW